MRPSMLGLPLATARAAMALTPALLSAATQASAAIHDTVFVRSPPSRGALEAISAVASVVNALAIMVLTVFAVPVAWHFRKMYRNVNHLVERVYGDIMPVMHHARSIADNVNYVTASIRSDVEKVNTAIHDAHDRVQQAVQVTEDRLTEFNALLSVVQEEAEQIFVSTASTVRGVRTGAAMYRDARGRGGMEFASDELDPAEVADALESQLGNLESSESSAREEDDDGDDGSSDESAAQALPAAPRIRPRPRH